MGDGYTSDMDDRGDISGMLDINLHRRRAGKRPLTVEEMTAEREPSRKEIEIEPVIILYAMLLLFVGIPSIVGIIIYKAPAGPLLGLWFVATLLFWGAASFLLQARER